MVQPFRRPLWIGHDRQVVADFTHRAFHLKAVRGKICSKANGRFLDPIRKGSPQARSRRSRKSDNPFLDRLK